MGTRGVASWRGAPKPLPPSPDGHPLEIAVACRTSRDAKGAAARHPITLDLDWSVLTPHDLSAERVAAAFGGYLSCLTLIDATIPATREWLRRATRSVLPRMTFAGGPDRWRLKEQRSCCPSSGFPDAVAAAEHWRSRQHIAVVMDTSRVQLSEIVSAVRSAHTRHATLTIPPGDGAAAARLCFRGDLDVAWLWSAGIHPRWLCQIHSKLGTDAAMPARFFLGVLWNRPDVRWIAETLAGRDELPSAHVREQPATSSGPVSADPLATWLAWSASDWDVIDPDARGRWLDSRVSRPMILMLGAAGYDPDDIVAHAKAVGRTPDGVARTIGAWVRNGFTPTPESLTALADAGVPAGGVPSKAAVARLRAFVEEVDCEFSDTDLALLLLEHGTVADATDAIAHGAKPHA